MMIGQTLSHYRIRRRLVRVGWSRVYEADDDHLDREVAVKVLPCGILADEQARKRFRKDALAISMLNHPNIATVHDFDAEDELFRNPGPCRIEPYEPGDRLLAGRIALAPTVVRPNQRGRGKRNKEAPEAPAPITCHQMIGRFRPVARRGTA